MRGWRAGGNRPGGAGASAGVRAAAAHFAEPLHRVGGAELIAVGLRPAGGERGRRERVGEKDVRVDRDVADAAPGAGRSEAWGGGRKGGASVRARTDYVVVATEAGVKREQARTPQEPVIDKAEMLRLIEGRGAP